MIENSEGKKKGERETVGTIARDFLMRESPTLSPIELEREAQKKYLDELLIAIERGKKIYGGDFYVEVNTKMEHLMTNVTRNYFVVRSTCPTPFFDQSVFKYDHKEETLTYLWTVPNRDACYHLKDNALLVAPEEQQLLQFVLDFFDGTLLAHAQKLNNETSDAQLAFVKVDDPDTLIKV